MQLARLATNIVAAVLLTAVPAVADPAIDALVAAYPDFLVGSEGNVLIWKDGTRMPISDGRTGKSFKQLLDHPDIKDQFAIPYPLGGQAASARRSTRTRDVSAINPFSSRCTATAARARLPGG